MKITIRFRDYLQCIELIKACAQITHTASVMRMLAQGGSTASRFLTAASFLLSISLLAASFALVPAAQAQNGVIANVPFEFSINNQRLAAGTYRFDFTSGSLTSSSRVLLVICGFRWIFTHFSTLAYTLLR
jgi:hypothetical protein